VRSKREEEVQAGSRKLARASASIAALLVPLVLAVPSWAAVPSVIASSAQPPTITSFSPTSGAAGVKVTIKGTNLAKATKITFNGKAAKAITDTATKIVTKVPSGATTGKIKVVTAGGSATSRSKFKVT
jgi:hypothetical protein